MKLNFEILVFFRLETTFSYGPGRFLKISADKANDTAPAVI
jgi:hypothetical protein